MAWNFGGRGPPAGLVDEVVDNADARAEELAAELAELPPLAVKALKEAPYTVLDSPTQTSYLTERALFGLLRYTKDF